MSPKNSKNLKLHNLPQFDTGYSTVGVVPDNYKFTMNQFHADQYVDELDGFAYDTAHLQTWHLKSSVVEKLPVKFVKDIISFQRAGAIVLSSFDRLEQLEEAEEVQEVKISSLTQLPSSGSSATEISWNTSTPATLMSNLSLTPPLSSPEKQADKPVSVLTAATIASQSIKPQSKMDLTPPDSPTTTEAAAPQAADSSTDSASKLSKTDGADSKSTKRSTYLARSPVTTLTIGPSSSPALSRYRAERFFLRTEALCQLRCRAGRVDNHFDDVALDLENDVLDELIDWLNDKLALVQALRKKGDALKANLTIDL